MKLTVAVKVIIGFSFITLLLIIASLSALNSFSRINSTNNEVNDVAVPAQQQSNLTQIQLLQLTRLTASGFNAETQNDIVRFQQQFLQQQESFTQLVNNLQQLSGDNNLRQQIQAAASHAANYQQATAKMFSARIESLNYLQLVEAELGKLESLLDEAGAALIELTELELPRNRQTAEIIAGTAGRLDGQLIGLINTLREMAAYTDNQQFERNKENVSFALSDMQVNVDYLEQLAGNINTSGLWPAFAEQWQSLTEQLEQSDNLVYKKQLQLAALQQARQALNLAESEVSQGLMLLEQIVNSANERFNQLQLQSSSDLKSGNRRTWFIMLVLVALATTTAYFTRNAMLKPLSGINRILNYVSQGDLTRKLNINQHDEFGALSEKVNSLISALSSLLTNIQQNSRLLNSTSHRSSAAIDEINQSLHQQQQQISSVSQISEQLSVSSQNVTSQATAAGQAMQQAMQQSQQISQLAETNNKRIMKLADQLNITSNLMGKVNDESTNIGSILTTISAIAEQTNLLALNAAIEAARAGEQGRGFAVVADEVRSLAGRTQQATGEIRQMIEHLQQQSQQAVHAVHLGRQDADQCVTTMTSLVAALTEVTAAISATFEISNAVTEASNNQYQLGQEISSRMQQMITLAEQSAEQADQTQAESLEVAKLAEQLQANAAKFKI